MTQDLPLAGVRVLELATVVAAPTAARIMAAYGAQVIKVEAPNGDLLRPLGTAHQLPAEDGNNPLFDLFNAGKELAAINLKTPEGMALFHRLLARSDVFITNVRMRSLEKMGLGYETLKEAYPRLIYAHFSGFGLTGPDVDRPGFDSTAFWLRSGASQDWLTPGAFPLRPSFAFGDLATANAFLSGILMALLGRQTTGHGTMLSTSLHHSGIWCSASAVLNSQYGKEYPADRYAPWDPFSNYYECADGEWIAIMEKEYSRDKATMARLFDMPELLSDPRLATLAAMRQSGALAEISRKMEALMRTRPAQEWTALLDANDIPNERLRHYREIADDAQANANDVFDRLTYSDGKTAAMPTPPIRFSDFGRRETRPTGAIGADTDKVLRELGYSDGDIVVLHEKKAVT